MCLGVVQAGIKREGMVTVLKIVPFQWHFTFGVVHWVVSEGDDDDDDDGGGNTILEEWKHSTPETEL